MASNGLLEFQGTNKATFVGANSNIVLDTVTSSLGIGVDVDGPTSNLHVVGNAYVSTELTVGGTVTATGFAGNASTASALATPVNIGGVSFDGSAAIVPTTFGAATFSGDVAFDTDTLFVDSANDRVGIGTTSPGVKFQVGSNAETTPQYIRIRGNRFNEAGDICGIQMYNSTNSGDRGNSAIINSRGVNNYGSTLRFWTNPDSNTPALERMCINSVGNVGIGTTSPDGKLEIGHYGSEIGDLTALRMTNFATNLHGSVLTEYNLVVSDINAATGLGNGKFSIAHRPNKSNSLSHRLVIDNSGNVGIGNTTPTQILDVGSSLSNPFICRHLSGSLHAADKRDSVSFGRIDGSDFLGMKCRVDTHTALGYGNAANQTEIGFYTWGNSIASSRQVFAINASGNGNMIGILTQSSSGTTSDDRIKYNEEDIKSPLTLISQLNPQKYEKIVSVAVSEKEGIWIPTDEEWESVKSEYTYVDEFGFIAQDVRAVPELSFLVNGEETRTDTNTSTPEEYSNLTSEEQATYTPSYVYESNTITQQEYSNLTHEEQGVYTTQYTKQIETQTPLSLNYNGLFVLAIGAIKELKAENDAIKARLDALENA